MKNYSKPCLFDSEHYVKQHGVVPAVAAAAGFAVGAAAARGIAKAVTRAVGNDRVMFNVIPNTQIYKMNGEY